MKRKYPQDDPEFKISARCRSCNVKGIIIVRTETNDYGMLYKTQNKLDWCINASCIRYVSAKIPFGWIEDNEKAFDFAKIRHRELLRQGKWDSPYRKSYAESEIYSETAMATTSAKLRSMEAARNSGLRGRPKGTRGIRNADSESGYDGETLHDLEESQGFDALVYPLG